MSAPRVQRTASLTVLSALVLFACAAEQGSSSSAPLACDGALCDTTNGSGCDAAGRGSEAGLIAAALVALALSQRAIARTRARRSRGLPCAAFAAVGLAASPADAELPPAVDVVVHEEPPPRRILAIEWNPLPLLIDKLSANIVFVPVAHHAIVLGPCYVSTTTKPIYVFDDSMNATQLPRQRFRGFGGELGYRYYFGEAGPRGLFLGPSLILATFTAKAQDGGETPYTYYGVAADVGFQMLVADSVSLSLGGGLQYAGTSKQIPNQQLPASIYANGAVRPRLLASIGWAF
ncbi:MAG TPA: hypothetical protein VN253_03860 [Kofleriaceae bacterium]|nr:hypothetical protein [Kofleriaceae bacterium]